MQTTEELKREMYGLLEMIKKQTAHPTTARLFENALEAYLEALRKNQCALKMRNDAQRSIIEEAGGTNELRYQLQCMTQERDIIRNRLQAFEFANQAAGEELRKSQETVKRQREYISEMCGTAKASEPKPSTLAQDSEGNVSETICGPFYGQCQHYFRTQYAFPNGKLQKQCVFCMLIVEG